MTSNEPKLKPRSQTFLCALLAGVLAATACSTPPSRPAGDSAAEQSLEQASRVREITDLRPTVILVSIDGFRPDYLDPRNTPTLWKLASDGVRAHRLIPVFPTLTFPNHYTIATGLYPEEHGIVANTMKDPRLPEQFALRKTEVVDDPRWWKGEPIWVTAEKQGQKAATMFWPGSSAAIGGVRPSYWKPYDKSLPRERRVDQILEWLDLPVERRPTLLTLYFEDVDTQGHLRGPDSPEVVAAVSDVDRAMLRLLEGLKARGIERKVNLVITSDHGMVYVDPSHFIYLSDFVDLRDVDVVPNGSMVGLYPPRARLAELERKLSRAHPRITVYRRGAWPARYRYGNGPRTAPLTVVADEGWFVAPDPASVKHKPLGMHGYDPRLTSMAAAFIAKGPAFRSGAVVEPFLNLHIYALVANLLSLKPARQHGRLEAIREILRSPERAARSGRGRERAPIVAGRVATEQSSAAPR